MTKIKKYSFAGNFFVFRDRNLYELYSCSICGDSPKTIIMDGIAMGCRADLIEPYENVPLNNAPIGECRITDRVLIAHGPTRDNMAEYVGLHKAHYKSYAELRPLAPERFDLLLEQLSNHQPFFLGCSFNFIFIFI